MTDIPRSGAQRTARLASLPLGTAGRVAAGWGKRLTGRSAEEVNAEINARTAEQVFAVLGELKGGAMKFGQTLSVFEAAIPDELAAPYREALTKLQAGAPPMRPAAVRRVLDEQLGTGWRRRFAEFSEEPAAAASIGQVHRAVWHDGREVAVKVQYPGAEEALRSDLRQLQRFSRLFQAVVPGLEVKPLLTELRNRMVEKLDYRGEADTQRTFHAAYHGDPEIAVPAVVASAPKVLVSEWVTGTPLSHIIRNGSREERDGIGYLLSEFHFSAPERARLLHADPHPGNFLRLADGRLCVLDFGAAAKLPHGAHAHPGHRRPAGRRGPSGRAARAAALGGVRPGEHGAARGGTCWPTSRRSPSRCARRPSTSPAPGCSPRRSGSGTSAASTSAPAAP